MHLLSSYPFETESSNCEILHNQTFIDKMNQVKNL